jgi:hypothetical protein
MKVIIHIGPHKTASSYLQRELYKHKEELEAAGVIYPVNEWIQGGYGHAGLIDKSRLNEIGEFLNSLSSSNPDAKTVVLSSENFDRLNIEQVQNLSRVMRHDVEIVYYIRRFDKTLYANWQENIKFGDTDSLAFYLLRHISRPYLSNIINHCLVLDSWSNNFGMDSIKIIDYDDLIENKIDIYRHFLQDILSISSLNFFLNLGGKANISLSVEHAEILRWMHIMFMTRKNNSAAQVTQRFFQLLKEDNNIFSEISQVFKSNLKLIELNDQSLLRSVYNHFLEKYQKKIINGSGRFILDSIAIIDDDISPLENISSQLYNVKESFF